MDNNFSVKILESYMDIDKIHDEINNKLININETPYTGINLTR